MTWSDLPKILENNKPETRVPANFSMTIKDFGIHYACAAVSDGSINIDWLSLSVAGGWGWGIND